jgi:hypothetical protein
VGTEQREMPQKLKANKATACCTLVYLAEEEDFMDLWFI